MPKKYKKSAEKLGFRTPSSFRKKKINKKKNFNPKGFNPGTQKTQHRG